MNYKESAKILKEIEKAKKILVNCHRSPDPDSVGSALALRRVLMHMGKSVEVVCPDNVSSDSKFLESSEAVKKIDFDNFDFSSFDLFLILDSSEWSQVAGYGKEKIPDIKKIIIDHHYTNEKLGVINLVDYERSSTGEVLYKLFADWDKKITKEIAEDLLAGIIYDTSSLEHSSADLDTAKVFAKLMELGADKNKIIFNFYRNIPFDNIKLMGEVIKNMKIDKEHRFIWSAVPYETVILYPDFGGVKTMAANLFASSIEDTDFGLVMMEEKKDFLNISFRAKEGFDISKAAEVLGGGGHKQAGAAIIRNLSFDEAVEKALGAARKYARKD